MGKSKKSFGGVPLKFFRAPAQHRLNWLMKVLIEKGILTKEDLEGADNVRSPYEMEQKLIEDIKDNKIVAKE